MKRDIPHSRKKNKQKDISAFLRIGFSVLLLGLFFSTSSFARNNPGYDEISVFINVENVGGQEMPSLITGDAIYLSIRDVFDFLKIKNRYWPGADSITGFFTNMQDTFLIDKSDHRIVYKQKIFDLNPDDIIQTEDNLYLKSECFGEIFGLDCKFNFRTLSVAMKSKLELPVIKERREAEMRLNLDRLKGNTKVDTIIPRSNAFFRLGMADWSVNTTQYINRPNSNESQLTDLQDMRITLSLGSMIAGGEANVSLNYDNNLAFTNRNQYYLWRYVNNDNPLLRQTMIGTINPQSTSSIFSPVIGVQFTNSSTLNKQSFGTYRLSDFTKPNWIVELYINNVLIDYVTADASGFFSFEVPLLYGSSSIKLRYYGPWGEEYASEKNIVIPVSLLPSKKLEYTVSGGLVEDNNAGLLRSSINYGLSKHITIGSGIEYLSSVTSGPAMPFFNTFLRISPRFLFSGEYTYSVRSRGILTYYGPSNLHVQLNYTHYDKAQTAIYFNYLEERKLDISIPFSIRKVHLFTQGTASQIVYPATKYTNVKWLISGSLSGIGVSFTNYGLFTASAPAYLYGDLALSCKLPFKLVFSPQVQYDYHQKKLIFIKGGIEKLVKDLCFINLSCERNLLTQSSSIELAIRFNFSFSQIGLSARRSNTNMILSEYARGSVIYDYSTQFIRANTRTNVGRGGITVLAFLDLNDNGKRDAGEPKVYGLKPTVKGGTFEYIKKDTTHRALNLTPYVNYLIELDENIFENISWQIKNKTIKVTVDPNNLKLLEIPVSVKGEASGIIYYADSSGQRGIGRIKINFYKNDSTLVFSTITEDDGYFIFLGFDPGAYTVRIDPSQLDKLQMTTSPSKLAFNIVCLREGDVVEGLEFVLSEK